MKYASPYTPGAGAMPSYLAGRNEVLKNAEKALQALANGYPQKSVICYGLRGVGKTILLNAIKEQAESFDVLFAHIEIAEKRSFIVQIANMSKKIIHQMNVIETSAYVTTEVLSGDLTEMFVDMGRMAVKVKKSICFFIDEIQYMNLDEMEALLNALHRVNQLRLPIIVYGAGLPEVLKILGEVKPYAERLFKYILMSKLPDEEAADAIINPTNVIYEDEGAEGIKEL